MTNDNRVAAREFASISCVDNGLVLFLIAVALAAGYVVYRDTFNADARVGRKLRRLARVPIGEVKSGSIRVVGRVRGRGELLTAPLSRRPCVAFQVDVYEGRGRSQIRRLQLQDLRPFRLRDETGEAVIDTDGPLALALVRDQRGANGAFAHLPEPHLQALAGLLGIPAQALIDGPRRFRYEESALTEGANVTVGGFAGRTTSGSADGEGESSEALVCAARLSRYSSSATGVTPVDPSYVEVWPGDQRRRRSVSRFQPNASIVSQTNECCPPASSWRQ
jgi:hypothetical protein